MPNANLNIVDRIVNFFWPQAGAERAAARLASQSIEELASQGYDAAEITRHNRNWIPLGSTGDTNTKARQTLRNKSHDLFRNNPYALSAVNGVVSRICGRLVPDNQAVLTDGNPDRSFRELSKELWNRWSLECDFKGFPAQGGWTWDLLLEQIVREILLSGEVLVHLVRLTPDQAKKRNLTIPFVVNVISAERLDETALSTDSGTLIYQGIEFDPETGQRIAYHIRNRSPYDPITLSTKVDRVPASEILHIALPSFRPDQYRGVPLLSCCLDTFKMIQQLQECELIAARINACMAVGIRKTGQSPTVPSLTTPVGRSSTDENGNRVMWTEPGVFPVLGENEDLVSASTDRPNVNIEAFVQHLLRGIGTAFPIKACEVHGNYREHNFSSLLANENDVMPEVLSLHNFVINCVIRPIYEQVVITGRLAGWYGENFNPFSDPYELHQTEAIFPAPETRSINKLNEIAAAEKRVACGFSSVTQEAAKLGTDAFKNLEENQQWLEKAKAAIHDAYGLNVFKVPVKQVETSPVKPTE